MVLLCAAAYGVSRTPSELLLDGEAFEALMAHGEAFLHHIPGEASTYRMPYASVVLAWYHGHAPAWVRVCLPKALWAAPPVLAFQLGCMLSSPVAGAIGAVFAVCPLSLNETGMGEEMLYKLQVFLVAIVLAWRASLVNLRRSVLLGLSISLSLLCRSPLFLFPVLLSVYDLLACLRQAEVRRMIRSRLGLVLALLAASGVFLSPWVLMNWRLDHKIILLENGRSDCNVVSGALGIVPTIVGDYRRLAGIDDSVAALPWAVGYVLSHPIPYIKACWGRLAMAVGFHPLVCVMFLLTLALQRKSEPYRQLGLLVFYFIGVHCLPGLDKRYLEPVWIIMLVMSVSGAAAMIPRLDSEDWKGRLLWFFWPYWGCAFAAGLLVLFCVSAYPTQPGLPKQPQFSRALERNPDDAWLLRLYSRSILDDGDVPRSVIWGRKALALLPGQYSVLFTYVRALAAAGCATQVWMDRITRQLDPGLGNYRGKTGDGYLLETLWHLQKGRRSQAAASYALCRAQWRMQPPPMSRVETREEQRLAERLVQTSRVMADNLKAWLRDYPPSRRMTLLVQLAAMEPSARGKDVIFSLMATQAFDAAVRGDFRTMRAGLSRIPVADASSEVKRDVARVRAIKRDADRARMEAARARERSQPRARHDRLSAVVGADKDHLRALLDLYRRLGKSRMSAWLVARLMVVRRSREHEAELLLDSAEEVFQAGEPELTVEFINRAMGLDIEPENLGRVALLYQGLKDYPKALEILDRLVRLQPRCARWRSDRGVVRFLSGRKEDAAKDWIKAIDLDPRFKPAYQSLGALYSVSGRRQEALEIYHKVLKP